MSSYRSTPLTVVVALLCVAPAASYSFLPAIVARRITRRDVAAAITVGIMPAPIAAVAEVAAPPPMVEVDLTSFRKISGGGQYADLRVGSGNEVTDGSRVSLQWVLRRSNGYYVDGSVKMLSAQSGAIRVGDNFDEKDNFIFTVGDGTAMSGVDEGIKGMKQGGTRRLVLPVKQAYTLPIDKSPGPLPDGYGPRRQIERELQRQDPYNYFYLEVEATRVR